MSRPDYDAIIVGGGLAGLTAGILLGRAGARVMLIEKKQYPFHKVCGEYISNEVLDFLKRLGFDPFALGASRITKCRLSSPSGKIFTSPLGMGGFGLSRYVLDEHLFELAKAAGVDFLRAKVTGICTDEPLSVRTADRAELRANFVIGSYGKRALLDKVLSRGFLGKRSSFLAVKYHVRADEPADEVALHAFSGGYCGMVKIEADLYNLCYLYRREHTLENIKQLEKNIVNRNPHLKQIFAQAGVEHIRPEVISEISFARKEPVHEHVFMLGDCAGLIAPLCGNGMAMAIHSAKLFCELVVGAQMLGREAVLPAERLWLEDVYKQSWQRTFASRLRYGRILQPLFIKPALSEVALRTLHAFPSVSRAVIESTHGAQV